MAVNCRIPGAVVLLLCFVMDHARADYPVFMNMNERMAPTDEDWERLELRRLERAYGLPNCESRPIVIHGMVRYYPCPEKKCNEPLHESFQGVYGIRHPMPYYIPTQRVTIAYPEPPACADGKCRKSLPAPHDPKVVEKIIVD